MRSTQVTFRMPREREREFLASYMPDAWPRFEAHDDLDAAWFWRFGDTSDHAPIELEGGETLEGGGVILMLHGDPDPDAVVESEREHWEREADAGRLAEWETKTDMDEYEDVHGKLEAKYGPRGGELTYRLRPILCRTTVDLLEEFDEQLPAVGAETDENPVPIGQWAAIHYLFKQSGHDWYGEIDACRTAIENRLHSLATHVDAESAKEELAAVIESFKGMGEQLERSGE